MDRIILMKALCGISMVILGFLTIGEISPSSFDMQNMWNLFPFEDDLLDVLGHRSRKK